MNKLLRGQTIELRSGEHVTYIRRCYSEKIPFCRVICGNGKVKVIGESEVVNNLGPFPEDNKGKDESGVVEMFSQKEMEGK